MVKTVTRLSLCLVLALACATALAATKEGIVTINGGKQTVAMQHNSNFNPVVRRDPALKTIYSNLGTGTDVYYCCEGWTLAGSTSAVGEEVWIATPFTPTKKATLKQIDVGIGWVEGTNQITISLDADASGIPGKTIHSWSVKNMPTFGSSYTTLDTVKSRKGIKVGKKQYWVAATTSSADADLWGAWNFTYNFATGTFAYQINGGGWLTENSDLGAMDVLGK